VFGEFRVSSFEFEDAMEPSGEQRSYNDLNFDPFMFDLRK